MPKKAFDTSPLQGWRGETVEEHNASLRQFAEEHPYFAEHLGVCGCGVYVEGTLCTCWPHERKRSPAAARVMIEARRRSEHLKGLAKKREFPPLGRCPLGVCYWCRKDIVHGRVKQRAMHDGRKDEPDCRHAYALHTRRELQLPYLVGRDGPGCRSCGAVEGRWGLVWNCDEHYAEKKGFDGPCSRIRWNSALEVDHRVALAVAFEAFPDADRRRWFFSPANLWLLCAACHKLKTRADRDLLREAYALGEAHAKARVLDNLRDAGLLKTARTKDSP